MSGNMSEKKEVHSRKKYMDPSRKFLDWVNHFGFEQTFIGRLIYRLDRRFNLKRVIFLWAFCFILSTLLFYNIEFKENLKVGSVAKTDVKSPIAFQMIDKEATKEKRFEAERNTPPIFDYDSGVYEEALARVYNSFSQMRLQLRAKGWSPKISKKEEKIREYFRYKSQFEKTLGTDISDRIYHWLVEVGFNKRLQDILTYTLVDWSSRMILDGGRHALRETDTQVVIRDVQEGHGEEVAVARDRILDLRRRSQFDFLKIPGVDRLDKESQSNLNKLAYMLMVPNLVLIREETVDRRSKARESVLPVQISVQKNQIIVRAGSVVQPVHVTIINKIKKKESGQTIGWLSFSASFLFVVLILVFFSYLRRFTLNKVRVEFKDIGAMGMVTLIMVFLTKVFIFFTDSALMAQLGDKLPPSVFLYAAPLAAGPMMVGLLLSTGEVVWLFTAFIAIVMAIMVDMDFSVLILGIIGGMAGARGVYGCRQRNDIYWAGVRTGLVNSLIIAALLVLMGHLSQENGFRDLMWSVSAGFVGGVASAMVAMMLIPLLESAFNYTTTIKLLELSNLDHVLMKELMVKAPGTYHHALAVGTMVDEAAQKIEANALLAKVMAYYHDIGKMEHAQYFVENQRPGYNPHDYISPYMSKTILVAHVKDGAEMGIRHKLGKPIIDGILQHHGTTLTSYFYNKALKAEDEEIDHVEENDFRYPGPKPQFKEAALVMLADSIEAAARSIEEPTAHRLTALVKNIIQSKFIDGQLEECNLTFRDLFIIEETFKKTILSIYHHRIDYPHMREGKVIKGSKAFKNRSKKGSA